MIQTPVVQFQHAIRKINQKTIIDDLTFDIPAGEVFGFLGPNGAGKTTTIRMMVGLIKITQGDILIKGHSITKDFSKAIRNVGAIIENPELYRYLTGYQNLEHYARMIPGISQNRIAEMAEIVGLKDRIHEKVGTWSLGMRQRLGIAQALLHRPALLILDEPTNGLDPAGIHELRNDLKKLAHEEDITVFVSSHLLSEMQAMCDRIGIIQAGKLGAIQTISELIHQKDSSSVCIQVDPEQIESAKQLLTTNNIPLWSSDHSGELNIRINKKEIPGINKLLTEAGIQIYSIQIQEQTLEEKFLEITESKK